MAKKNAIGTSTSAAIREFLKTSPQASAKEAEAAIGGKFSQALYYNIRSAMGLGKKRKKRGRPKGTAAPQVATVAAPASGKGDGDYLALERTLDALVAQADQLGDRALAEALRNARRRVSAKLVR